MKNILEIKDFSKTYKDFKIDNLSFSLEQGYIMGFIGPNGSGKTTTIKAVMNLLKINSGSIHIFGKDHIKNEKYIKDNIGFVYDESPYFPNLSLKDNANIVAPFYSKWDNKAFNNYLEQFNLNPKKKLHKLSKGMKTKFSLAMALSHHAKFIIMDEPTAGLDPVFRREIIDIFYDIIQDGETSILLSTHITSDLDKIADFITFINNGQLIFSKPMDEIKDTFKLIKGSNDLLNKIPDNVFIGMRKTKYGFEGLTAKKDEIKLLLGDSVLIENAVLEDIMVYYNTKK